MMKELHMLRYQKQMLDELKEDPEKIAQSAARIQSIFRGQRSRREIQAQRLQALQEMRENVELQRAALRVIDPR